MPLVEFEPTIPVSAWPQTYALDRAATGIGIGIFNAGLLRRLKLCKIMTVVSHTWIIYFSLMLKDNKRVIKQLLVLRKKK
jgi:hypothetical protein